MARNGDDRFLSDNDPVTSGFFPRMHAPIISGDADARPKGSPAGDDDGMFKLPDPPAMDPQSGVLELMSELDGCLRLGTTSVSARVILERLGRIYESFEASP